MLKIALGTDHAGFDLKEAIKDFLVTQDIVVVDFGTNSPDSTDYPDFVIPAAEHVATGECELGIVFGGSGNGEAITANKVAGIRCGLCWNVESAKLTKEHNNANMIAMGGRMVSHELGIEIVKAWLDAKFEGGRHERRIKKVSDYERDRKL